ncbi:MAG: 2-hydroxyglutaryl-CoA dehydratase, partial [Clostridia bacterium]|nr:2-hydroxyglutaryl-CoA dehydratase [Clostridia bacterium]
CLQPFGCLPNHIVGRGMLNAVKRKAPNANIAAIDYDSSLARVNQENRIKLMLSQATPTKPIWAERQAVPVPADERYRRLAVERNNTGI